MGQFSAAIDIRWMGTGFELTWPPLRRVWGVLLVVPSLI